MNKSEYLISIATKLVLIMVPFFYANAQYRNDDQSKGVYRDVYINKSWSKLDKNRDGKFSESENKDKRAFNRLRKLDRNKDNEISFEEYASQVIIPYLDTGGIRKLNVLYKVTKEEDLYLDVYYPKHKKEGQKLPVVVYTHGGGWTSGSRHGASNASFKMVHEALLEEGFCVVSVSYRLWKKNGTTAMRDCVIDCKDALRYLSKNHKELEVDTTRFYSFGDSAGGQISQMLLLSSPESLEGDRSLKGYGYKMIAGVSWYGPCDFEKTSLFNHDDRPNFNDRFGCRILLSDVKEKDKLKLYREMSPINYLTPKSPSLLMVQGDSDTTIPVKHAYYMSEKAKTINADVTIMIVKNAGHNWRKVGADIDPTRQSIIKSTIDYFVSNK